MTFLPRASDGTRFVLLLAATTLFSLPALAVPNAAASPSRPNVLFIAVDDLRPQLGCYGYDQMISPNIDRLAAGGFVFQRAYCMVPTCGASRASLMTGIRPARNRFVNYLAWAEKDAPGVTTLNTHFRDHGYYTVSNGKVFHHPTDNAHGWCEPAWRPDREDLILGHYVSPAAQEAAKGNPRGRGPAYESAEVPDETYGDGRLVEKSVADLGRLAKMERPFFLAVGFFKPHLPFVAPKKYWDLYPQDEIRLPNNYSRPEGAPDVAIHSWGELRAYADIPKKGPLTDEMARTLIHGYYACVSYTDALVGRLLDELDRLDLADNTVVILWGDHGWNLGEHTLWCKHCCFETSMRAALVMRVPGLTHGRSTEALVEFIDIYPSLCDLAGLPLPDHLDGHSFVPLLRDPNSPGKPRAIGRYRRGDTIRTDRYRYTAYSDKQNKLTARMLYDHNQDPNETVNISELHANQEITSQLNEQLQRHKGSQER
jgi:arylsulfatase A-like enzyme